MEVINFVMWAFAIVLIVFSIAGMAVGWLLDFLERQGNDRQTTQRDS